MDESQQDHQGQAAARLTLVKNVHEMGDSE